MLNKPSGFQGLKLSNLESNDSKHVNVANELRGSPISRTGSVSPFLDDTGKLNFEGKAIIHAKGVDFSGGGSFKIALSELVLEQEIGRGQYGVVNKVYHRPTKVEMAMKQIRLDISKSTMQQILMELEVLNRSNSPYIVEFYGGFFVDSSVYLCMEFMDCGSLDQLYGDGIEESVLSRVAESVARGLQFLKEDLSVIHRDVKPTNILVNSHGDVKLCDFGVSGQLVQSKAKTYIGCQSYMAPERIYSSEADSSYSSSSDVWSLGMSLYEAATGRYPFPPETYDSVFAQLNAIINSPLPTLNENKFSQECVSFIEGCLRRDPQQRWTFKQMLDHPFLVKWRDKTVNMADWAIKSHEYFIVNTHTESDAQKLRELTN